MISDVLSDAVFSIDEYLTDPLFAEMYSGKLREQIVKLSAVMESMRILLDTPPWEPEGAEPSSETTPEQLLSPEIMTELQKLHTELDISKTSAYALSFRAMLTGCAIGLEDLENRLFAYFRKNYPETGPAKIANMVESFMDDAHSPGMGLGTFRRLCQAVFPSE